MVTEMGMSDEIRVPAAEWEAMKARLAALERLADDRTQLATGSGTQPAERSSGQETSIASEDGRTDRRGLLKNGAILAAGR